MDTANSPKFEGCGSQIDYVFCTERPNAERLPLAQSGHPWDPTTIRQKSCYLKPKTSTL
jgi:hypothetical protein